MVALVGVTLYRVLFFERAAKSVRLGLRAETLAGARVFVLPNPSGRNAHYPYREMLAAYRALSSLLRLPRVG